MAKAVIETYGCTLNRADSDIMEGILKAQGISVDSGRHTEAGKYDYVIVNTCTVKTPTERRIIDRLRHLSKSTSRLIVTGCMASANADMIRKAAPGASIVTTSNIHRIADAVNAAGRSDYTGYSKIDKLDYAPIHDSVISRIPISEGCMSSCSFCETKFARGPLNSFSDKLIVKAAEMSVKNGAREIELTSQDVGAYGLDRKTNIAELVSSMAEIEGDFRIRIGMLNPEHLHRYLDGLISALKQRNVYKFLHLPVQSGSNKVLRDMKRNYGISEFCEYVNELRLKVDGISIETDMIVGYPTESDSDFDESMSFLSEWRPTFTNVSRFGARPHASASRLKQLGSATIKQRSSEMSRLARAVQKEDFSRLVGCAEDVIITEENEKSLVARDDCYRIIALDKGNGLQVGDNARARITGNSSVCLFGVPAA